MREDSNSGSIRLRMAKLFISHASRDKEIARQLSNDLRVLGHSVWLDEWSIIVGQCISSEIDKALADTQFLILLLSKNAVLSRWVDTEWRAAYWDELQSRSIIVLPVLLEKVQLPKLLQTKKHASFVLSYAVGFSELVNAIAHYESSSSIKSTPAQRRRERKKHEDVERRVERSTTLRLVKDSGADTEPQFSNVINIGGTVSSSIIANKVQISGRGMPRMNYPIGSVGASVQIEKLFGLPNQALLRLQEG
jgi:TIR domain